jgi:hypothetical protein
MRGGSPKNVHEAFFVMGQEWYGGGRVGGGSKRLCDRHFQLLRFNPDCVHVKYFYFISYGHMAAGHMNSIHTNQLQAENRPTKNQPIIPLLRRFSLNQYVDVIYRQN